MGTLLGHVVPGTFFIIFALWWGFSIGIKYYCLHHRKQNSKKSKPYLSTTTFPCLCFYSSNHIPVESYLKIFSSVIGMLGEFITGFTHLYDEKLKRKVWGFGENNAQHITMFLGFGLASIFEVLAHYKYRIPDGTEFLANIIAFGMEGFLFHFHLHGRTEVDIHVHVLLVYAIGFCFIAAVWEYNRPNQILATYARIIGTLLQGLWFYAVGFILYFPSDNPYWIWAPTHENILLLTAVFVWVAIMACFIVCLQTYIVWSIMKRRHYKNGGEMYNGYLVPNSMQLSSENEEENNDDNQIEFAQKKEQFFSETCT